MESCRQWPAEPLARVAGMSQARASSSGSLQTGGTTILRDQRWNPAIHVQDYTNEMSEPFLEECLSVLTRTPEVLDALLRDLPEVLTMATEGPGTWSPYVVIRHLIYGEKTDWMPRLRIILEHGANRIFDPYDHEGQFREPERRPLPELLDEFRDLRLGGIAGLRAMNLTDAQLELNGRHPALGLVTARQLMATWTAHDLGHLVQVSRVIAKRYKSEVGPWVQYQSVMK